jgi:hypothetical protein
VAREAEIPFLDRHQLMTWWASSRTLYPDELLGEDALHMADRSYECLAIRLETVFEMGGGVRRGYV